MQKNLKARNIVIVGGSSGIGAALAKECLRLGHTVFLVSRSALKSNLSDSSCYKISCDIQKLHEIEDAQIEISKILSKLDNQSLDCLINSAGVGYEKRLQEITEKDFDLIFQTNVKGLIFSTKTFLPLMVRENSVICNISSIAGVKGFPIWSLYSASKFAVEGFTASLRNELRDQRIKVMTVRLGSVDTPFYSHVPKQDKKEFMNADQVAKILLPAIFTEDPASVEEIFINNTVGDL